MDPKVVNYPQIPSRVVVHLGNPDEASREITTTFPEYIKNVASSEIYPTWPEQAIRANIIAIISFALSRIYNEYYPSRGFNFDITSKPAYDQAYIEDRQIFDNISKIVDEIFNNYVVKENQIQPYFTRYCDGKNTTCDGLSQWGTVTLANQGKNALEILRNYYGSDINLVTNAEVADIDDSYPGFPLELGTAGNMVRIIQRELNRIRRNYPAIPDITTPTYNYNVETEAAVRKFQEIFNLNPTGIVDKATWYKIKYVYNAVKKINDLYSEGINIEEAELKYENELKYSDTGIYVRVLHYYLIVIAYFDDDIPLLEVDSVYDENTKNMVIAFQNKYNLPATGRVDEDTWIKLKEVYENTIQNIPQEYLEYEEHFYPGRFLSKGMSGEDVYRLQRMLLTICKKYGNIPGVRTTGTFDDLTEQSVRKLQSIFEQELTGIVGPVTWYNILNYSLGEILKDKIF